MVLGPLDRQPDIPEKGRTGADVLDLGIHPHREKERDENEKQSGFHTA